ncbi:60S acidic ribosomal protein Rpp1-3 [Schizosaccharomyces cryophilus OY26]|uniref:60S acidic ribosomal protein Rpp1-3 n=1 Tax=Schizosaccharomyces cryophilus (strain OY26 / ATCC MYA-4695 / CBS 11777 / NBRC 106824 / NRRL Y48691) TaxID=653667 RepID=S9VTD5_SCHCR|nr:60S acidic ribosomal protein Rpp1-3 [Schizosaccharomyces cryophilus OY26]EPY51138.1 60S acidic ribosomal protein Rpp1-3 [Schizosaccharomyces cryophilus OY26]
MRPSFKTNIHFCLHYHITHSNDRQRKSIIQQSHKIWAKPILREIDKLLQPFFFTTKHEKAIKMSASELATSYAALILADEGIEITSDKLLALTKAGNVEVEPIWASIFAKALEGKDLKELLLNIGSGAAAGPVAAGAPAAAGEAPAEEKKEEPKVEEESDEDMGFGLFD